MTNSEFVEAISRYKTRRGFNMRTLSAEFRKRGSVVSKWYQHGIEDDLERQEVVNKYPWIFSEDGGQSDLPPRTFPSQAKVASSHARELPQLTIVAVKTEIARFGITQLGVILKWFIFKATPEDRDRFRDELGEDWNDFLDLTRALTGETALQVTQQEGRLDKWRQ